jgi:predicted esterase
MLMRTITAGVLAGVVGVCSCAFAIGAEDGEQASTTEPVVYEIKPSETDRSIVHFDDPHVVILDRASNAAAQLVVFMPGTDGKPRNAMGLLRVVAAQGYRVVGLEYNDSPAVVQVCPRNPPSCSGDFRHKRIFGDGVSSVIENTPAESIVNRLVKLLQYLDQAHPGEGWSNYLQKDAPDWSRIVVSGLSQGAGMAAYIAKREPVARVVLFSSPWDYSSESRSLAPWIGEPSVRPPERWFAEYHRRENTADLIARAYVVLRIPAEHVRIFDLDVPGYQHGRGSNNPYHGSTIRLPEYAPEWRFLFGHSP